MGDAAATTHGSTGHESGSAVTDLLLPAPDEDTAPFWRYAAEGELRVQRCEGCGRLRFPPRPMCPECRSMDTAWQRMSGLGTIWSYVVVHRPVLPAYEPFLPYPVVVVQLEEDHQLRMVGNVVAAAGAPIDSVDPDALEIGQPVEVTFEPVSDDIGMPRWLLR